MSVIGGITVRNTRDLISPEARICTLIYAPRKMGKTTFAATLDKKTKRFNNKPSLIIACEAAEGGGTMSIADLGIDFVQPRDWNELGSVVAALQTDTKYGGIIVDPLDEIVDRCITPYALKMPYEKAKSGAAPLSRAMGVPAQGDYQTMGEMLRSIIVKLMNLTRSETLVNVRKDLVCVAPLKHKTDRDGKLIQIQPDLPGGMADGAAGVFQTVGQIQLAPKVIPGPDGKTMRVNERVFITEGTPDAIMGDRTKKFPKEFTNPDFEVFWEKYWLPSFEEKAV